MFRRFLSPALVIVAVVAAVVGVVTLRSAPPGQAVAPSASIAPPTTPQATPAEAPTESPTAAPSARPESDGPRATVDARIAPCQASSAGDAAVGCYAGALAELVRSAEDPRAVVDAIAEAAWDTGGDLLANCHSLMHTVARELVPERGITLATLVDYLPSSNDPGCTAGYSHGLLAGLGPEVAPGDPAAAARVCEPLETRYQRYSCIHGFGHAFMRLASEDLSFSLALCDRLGERAAPDCAQGAYHDYWFAVIGADGLSAPAGTVTDPRELCADQPERFVAGCWYRAFIETRPWTFVASTPGDFDMLCGGLTGVQRSACVTATSVIGPPDPVDQLALCAELDAPDIGSCIRGTKVQNLLREPPEALDDLIARCDQFDAAAATDCYAWLGRILAVVTDGAYERTGCPKLEPAAARDACVAGARAMEEALVTFS
jgi:hypothetical protein